MGNTQTKAAKTGSSTAEIKQDQKQTTAPAPTLRITREEFLKSIAHYQNGNDKQKKLHQNLIKLYDNDPSLTSLNLGFNNIGDQGAQAIAEILANNTTLTSLNLRSNNIDDQGAQAIAKALANNTTLTSLNLGWNNIDDQGVQAIAEALANNTTLTSLDFYDNNIGDQGAQAIAESLRDNTTLTYLVLSTNNIGLQGAQAIAEALANNTTLTRLDLYDNNIGDQGARAIAKGLANNTTLTSLDLSWNYIGAQGAQAIAEGLRNNTTLTSLNLRLNNIGYQGAQAIAQVLANNTTLTSLNLYNNNIGYQGAQAIADALRENTTLTRLNLKDNNPIDLPLTNQIETLLNRNQVIQGQVDQLNQLTDELIGNDIRSKTNDEISTFVQEKLSVISVEVQPILDNHNNIDQKEEKEPQRTEQDQNLIDKVKIQFLSNFIKKTFNNLKNTDALEQEKDQRLHDVLDIIKNNTSPQDYESLMEGFPKLKKVERSALFEKAAILDQAQRSATDNKEKVELGDMPSAILEGIAGLAVETQSLTEDERSKALQEGFDYETKAGKAQATEDTQVSTSSSSSSSSVAQEQDQKQTIRRRIPGVTEPLPPSGIMDAQGEQSPRSELSKRTDRPSSVPSTIGRNKETENNNRSLTEESKNKEDRGR